MPVTVIKALCSFSCFINITGDIRNTGSIPGSGRYPGEGNSNPLQYSCLENSMDKEPGGLQSKGLLRVRHD